MKWSKTKAYNALKRYGFRAGYLEDIPLLSRVHIVSMTRHGTDLFIGKIETYIGDRRTTTDLGGKLTPLTTTNMTHMCYLGPPKNKNGDPTDGEQSQLFTFHGTKQEVERIIEVLNVISKMEQK